jgi:hypothetical protein
VLVPTPARAAAFAAVAAFLLVLPAPVHASIAPATPIDGPSGAILGVDGVAMSEDGTGGLVYRKRVNGRANVYVSRFTAKGWQAPQRVDVGQAYNSSWPAIGAGDGGRLVVTWVHEFGGGVQNRMYSAVLGPGATRFQAPIALDLDVREGLDAYPSLSMSRGGAAYLAYRVVLARQDPNLPPGTIDADIRLARFQGSFWSVLGNPVDRNAAQPMRTPTATNGPQVATDAGGNAVVAWSEPDDDLIDRVYARRVFGQSLGFVLQVSPGTDPGAPGRPLRAGPDQFALSLSPFGEAAIAYRQQPASGASFTRPRAYVNMLPSIFAEKAGMFTGVKAIDTGTSDGPAEALGPVSVAVDDEGGFEAGIGVGAAALLVGGDETTVAAPVRLDDGSSIGAPDPLVERGRGGALAAAFRLAAASGAAGVGLLERGSDGTPTTQTVATEAGGPVRTLLAAGSGLGDAAVAFLQGEDAGTTLAATAVDAPPADFSAATPPDWVNDARVELAWDAAPAAIGRVTYELLIDGDAVAGNLKGLKSTVKASTIGDGDHQVTVTATDSGDQSTSTPVASLKLDRTPPKVRVSAVRRARLASVKLSDGAKDDVSGVAVGTSSVRWGDGKRASGRRTLRHRYARAGSFAITVTARDKAGNKRVTRRAVRVG